MMQEMMVMLRKIRKHAIERLHGRRGHLQLSSLMATVYPHSGKPGRRRVGTQEDPIRQTPRRGSGRIQTDCKHEYEMRLDKRGYQTL